MAHLQILMDGPKDAPMTLVLAHGAGLPMDAPFMNTITQGLATIGLRVARFEFPYMAQRRGGGPQRPPDRPEILLETYRQVITALGPEQLAIGGKSLGGRMASMVADETGVRAVVCLGYPFHPQGHPERLRVEHLASLKTPTLICQGTRDPLGTSEEVAGYSLSPAISLHWSEDGDHHLAPRKSSGRSPEQNWADAIHAIGGFLRPLAA